MKPSDAASPPEQRETRNQAEAEPSPPIQPAKGGDAASRLVVGEGDDKDTAASLAASSSGWLTRLRLRIGVRLLRPHWLPLLEHYNRMQLAEHNPRGRSEREHCTYIVIGIKHAIGASGWWPK